ncbi:MAG: hypothetical protein JO061_01100 [Acidobacteriaceae bacterium]|nr:hypothetical protein [Acidobacteriaceae bacterium]
MSCVGITRGIELIRQVDACGESAGVGFAETLPFDCEEIAQIATASDQIAFRKAGVGLSAKGDP